MSPKECVIFPGLITNTVPVDAEVTVFGWLLIQSRKAVIVGFAKAEKKLVILIFVAHERADGLSGILSAHAGRLFELGFGLLFHKWGDISAIIV